MRCPLMLALALAISLLVHAPDFTFAQSGTFLGRKTSDWLADLQSRKPATRRSAAFALGRLGADAISTLNTLGSAVKNDTDDGVRDMAASAIGDILVSFRAASPQLEWESLGATLRQALADKSPAVRRSAAYAIGAFGTLASSASDDLLRALSDPNAAVRQNAAWALGRVATTEASVAQLCQRLGSTESNSLVKRDAASALGQLTHRLGRPKLRSAVRPLLDTVRSEMGKDDVVTKTALSALATLVDEKNRGEAADLLPLLDSKDPELARTAAYALANMGGDPARRATPRLREALRDPDPGVQEIAAAHVATAAAAAAAAAPDLARVLEASASTNTRRNCAIALSRIARGITRGEGAGTGSEKIEDVATQALPALIKVFKEMTATPGVGASAAAHEEVRGYLMEAIAYIDFPHNRPALPLVRETLRKDSAPGIRQRCIWALFNCTSADLDKENLKDVLVELLDEKDPRMMMVRYDAARVLAFKYEDRAPDKVHDVLLHMITNDKLNVFDGSGLDVEGLGGEGAAGSSRATSRRGGDARYMAAEAMGMLGDKARKDKRIMDALENATRDRDTKLVETARRELEKLRKPAG